MSELLDGYIARFQNLPSFNIYHVSPDGKHAQPWMEVSGEEIARELIFDELHTMPQVDTVSADIQKWGRLESMARRVWQLAERELRTWKASFLLDVLDPPKTGEDKPGWTTTAKGEPKQPSQAVIEALYRVDEEYQQHCREIERAEEAYNATHAVVEGFRAKRDMIRGFAKRYNDA